MPKNKNAKVTSLAGLFNTVLTSAVNNSYQFDSEYHLIVRNLSRLNFATRFLKQFTEGAFTTSSGREFHTVQILLQKTK